MTKIVVGFQPFALNQNIGVYTDGKCVEEVQVPVSVLNDIVDGLRTKYSAQEIVLCGNVDYLSRFKAEMSTKFDNSCEINIISK